MSSSNWLAITIALVSGLGGVLSSTVGSAQTGAPPAASGQAETPEHARRIQWFRQAKFGLFIHWGLYAIPAGEWQGRRIPGIGEWIMNRAKIPVREYEKLAAQFNP